MRPCTGCSAGRDGCRVARKASTNSAAPRPSAMAHTTSDCPRRQSPAANTPCEHVLATFDAHSLNSSGRTLGGTWHDLQRDSAAWWLRQVQHSTPCHAFCRTPCAHRTSSTWALSTPQWTWHSARTRPRSWSGRRARCPAPPPASPPGPGTPSPAAPGHTAAPVASSDTVSDPIGHPKLRHAALARSRQIA